MEEHFGAQLLSAFAAERAATIKAQEAQDEYMKAVEICEKARRKYLDILQDIDKARADAQIATRNLEALSDDCTDSSSRGSLGTITRTVPTRRDRFRVWLYKKRRAAGQAPSRVASALYEMLAALAGMAVFLVRN